MQEVALVRTKGEMTNRIICCSSRENYVTGVSLRCLLACCIAVSNVCNFGLAFLLNNLNLSGFYAKRIIILETQSLLDVYIAINTTEYFTL